MKLTNWQLIAALAVLFAAIIGAHIFAPGATAIVVSMATTAFGALFLNRKDPPPPNDGGGPTLRVIPGGASDSSDESKPDVSASTSFTMGAVCLALALSASACGAGFVTFDELNNPSDDAALARCRNEARAAKDAGADAQDAYDRYHRCTQDAGLR